VLPLLLNQTFNIGILGPCSNLQSVYMWALVAVAFVFIESETDLG